MGARTPHDLGPDDLVWDNDCRPRDADVVERIHAAAAAGYAAIGLSLRRYEQLRAEGPAALERIDEALAATGLVLANIETLRGWTVPGHDDACRQREPLVWEMAARWGCRYVQVIGDAPDGPLDGAAAGFAALCDRAAEHGLAVGLEWVPQMTNIGDPRTALRIVLDADRANGGLCVDSWHWTRSTNDLDDLRAIPGDKVVATQWNDGPVVAQVADYFTDTTTNRVVPGEGEFALVEMARVLDAIGSRAPIGLEIHSTALYAAPVDEAARRAADAMRAVLTAARRG